MSSEIEDVVPPLIRKAAEVSTAGRENFLTQYADAALSQMVLSCSEVQCTKALLSMCASYAGASVLCTLLFTVFASTCCHTVELILRAAFPRTSALPVKSTQSICRTLLVLVIEFIWPCDSGLRTRSLR